MVIKHPAFDWRQCSWSIWPHENHTSSAIRLFLIEPQPWVYCFLCRSSPSKRHVATRSIHGKHCYHEKTPEKTVAHHFKRALELHKVTHGWNRSSIGGGSWQQLHRKQRNSTATYGHYPYRGNVIISFSIDVDGYWSTSTQSSLVIASCTICLDQCRKSHCQLGTPSKFLFQGENRHMVPFEGYHEGSGYGTHERRLTRAGFGWNSWSYQVHDWLDQLWRRFIILRIR